MKRRDLFQEDMQVFVKYVATVHHNITI